MRSRRHYSSEAVYWPAFADIMTVLVVILLCTFAVTRKAPEPSPKQDGTVSGKAGSGGQGSPLPLKTEEEYQSAVLGRRRSCVLKALKKDTNNVLNDSLQTKLCSLSPSLDVLADGPNQCMVTLQGISEAFTHGPSLQSMESRYSIQFGKLYLRANTGLGSTEADILKRRLREAQDYLKASTAGPFAHLGLLSPEYTEQGPADRSSEITFGISIGLGPDLAIKIDRLWKEENASALEEILRKSNSCERIGG